MRGIRTSCDLNRELRDFRNRPWPFAFNPHGERFAVDQLHLQQSHLECTERPKTIPTCLRVEHEILTA